MQEAHESWLRQRQGQMKEARAKRDAAAMAGVRADASQARQDATAALANQHLTVEETIVTPEGAVVRVALARADGIRRADSAPMRTQAYREDVIQPGKVIPNKRTDDETQRLRVKAQVARDVAMESLSMGAAR